MFRSKRHRSSVSDPRALAIAVPRPAGGASGGKRDANVGRGAGARAVGLLGATLLLGATGCSYEIDDDDRYVEGAGRGVGSAGAFDDAYFTTVDRGVVLNTALGEGAGVFVEYAEGGQWTLWTTCDTLQSDYSCLWDVHVSSQRPVRIDTIELSETELDQDFAEVYSDNDFSFFTETTFGRDVITFRTDPRSLVQVDIVLDGWSEPGFLRWSLFDEVQGGAPYGPVVFQPDGP
ncbi:MAG: hypothetical protein AAF928_12115 [Myxococcota bacterium]